MILSSKIHENFKKMILTMQYHKQNFENNTDFKKNIIFEKLKK